MLQITLFTKTGCSLCDAVEMTLSGLTAQFPHQLNVVDITTDPDLFDQYRYSIPVVVIGDTVLQAPIADVQLVEALQTAVAATTSP